LANAIFHGVMLMPLSRLSLSPTRNCSRSRESQGSDGGSSVVAKTLKRTGNTVLNPANPAKRFLAEKKASTLTFGSEDAFDLPALKNHSGPVRIGHFSPLKVPVPAVTERVLHGFENFSEVNWPDSEIYDIDMKGVLFAKAILINLVLRNVDFSGSYFGDANLAGATLKSTDLSRCKFPRADLTNLDCDDVNFSKAEFSRTILESVNFSGCNLSEAELFELYCYDVNLSGANLSGAKLKSVNFSGCDFTGANLTNLDIDEVDFSGVKLNNAAMSLSQECVMASLRAPIIYTPGPDDSIPKKGIGNLLNAIDSINPEHQEQKNALMRSLIDRMDKVEWPHVMLLAKVLFKDLGYDGDPVIARFNEKLLIPWLQIKERQPPSADKFDIPLMINLVNRHPGRTREWASTYGKTLTLYEGRASSGTQTASLQTPAITGETARN
jgi:uncharacterized protein YjbI with pentapeptide repeats